MTDIKRNIENFSLARIKRDSLLQDMERSDSTKWVPPRLDDLKSYAAKNDVTVVQTFATDTNLIVWALSPDGIDVRTVFLPRAVLEEKVKKIRDSFDADASGQPPSEFPEATARELYLYLIAWLEPILGHKRHLVVIPQGVLGGLPFEALINPKNGRYLIEERTLSYAPSAAFLLRDLTSQMPQKMTVLKGKKIPKYTATYAGTTWLEGYSKLAPQDDIVAALSGPGIVHVMAHGEHETIEPLLSNIEFTEEKITAARLASFDLTKVDLFVAAACESGRLKQTITNESLGIAWGVLAAGAKNAVVARWSVNDIRTDIWMGDFYSVLGKRRNERFALSIAKAAQSASLNALKDAKTAHPYFWSGFQVLAL